MLLDQPKLVFQTTANVSGSPTADQPQGETTNTAGMQFNFTCCGKKLNLLACHLCSNSTRTEDFLKKQPALFCNPGTSHPRSSVMGISENGLQGVASVLKDKLIKFIPL